MTVVCSMVDAAGGGFDILADGVLRARSTPARGRLALVDPAGDPLRFPPRDVDEDERRGPLVMFEVGDQLVEVYHSGWVGVRRLTEAADRGAA